jgi:hypothetical protein
VSRIIGVVGRRCLTKILVAIMDSKSRFRLMLYPPFGSWGASEIFIGILSTVVTRFTEEDRCNSGPSIRTNAVAKLAMLKRLSMRRYL